MRYLVIAIASTLTSCGGVSSFMTAMHPTEEHCDADFHRCVTSPESQKADTTGSLPSQTKPTEEPPSPPAQQVPAQPTAQQPPPQQPPPQQPQPQRPPTEAQQQQQSRTSVPIEQEALIEYENTEMATEYAHYVRASGYRCDSISALAEHLASVTLACNQSSFRYVINWDQDGRLTVTVE